MLGGMERPIEVVLFDVDGVVKRGGTFARAEGLSADRGYASEKDITGNDLIAFGLPRELVERCRAIIEVEALDEETLARIVSCADLNFGSNDQKR